MHLYTNYPQHTYIENRSYFKGARAGDIGKPWSGPCVLFLLYFPQFREGVSRLGLFLLGGLPVVPQFRV